MGAIDRAKLTASFAGAFNVTGQPAISLPLALRPRTGLPIGIQLVAPLGREDLLIRVAAAARAGPSVGRSPPAGVRRPAS